MTTTTGAGGGRDTPSPVNVDYTKHLPIQGSSNKFQYGKDGGEHSLVCLNPLWKQRLHWDVILSVLFFYNATVIPIYICYVDIGLCFETGIYAGELIIMKRHEVRQIYFKTWFLFDVISTIPYDLIAFLIIYSASPVQDYNGYSSTTILSRLTLIELMKLVRLVRFLKTNHLFNIFEKALVFRYEDLAKIKFTLFVFFCLHWSACIFSWLDENVCENDPNYSVFIDSGLSDRGNGARYLASFYWALATMVTIGYGDISARCTATRLFSLIIMFMASAVYAYGLSYVMDVIRKNRKQQEEFRELMDMANRYMDFREIPNDLREELRKFFNFKSESEAKRNDLLSERLILNELSPELRFAVLRHVNSGLLDKVPFFQEIGEVTKDSDILQEVVLHLQSQVFRPNEIVIKEGDLSDELFFITKGTCMLVKWGTITTKVLPEGSFHGETGFLAKTVSIRASTRFSTPFAKFLLPDQLGNEPNLPNSLKRQTTERSVNNSSFTGKQITPSGPSSALGDGSFSEDEYLQSHTFITQTYADLRYITRGTFDTILASLPKLKLEKVYRIMSRRYELFVAAELEEERELMEKFPEAYEEYMFDDDVSSSNSEDDWRKNDNDVLDEEIKSGPEGITGHGGGLLRRVLSRNLSQGSIKGTGPTHIKHSPRVKLSPIPPQMKGVLKNRFNYDSPRKASAPAVLSPSQQEFLSSKSSSPSKPHRATMAVLEEFDEQERLGLGSAFSGSTNPPKDYRESNDEADQQRGRRTTPRYSEQEFGRQARITKRTSLSSLAEMGFVAPTPEKPMRYHNVVPARASLFIRQKSKHLSRDDIGGAVSGLGASPDRGMVESRRKSHRGSTSTARQRRRSLLSKMSHGSGIVELKTFSYSDADTVSGTGGPGKGIAGAVREGDEEDMKQLVTEIDGLMSQLTNIKRRLSQSSAEPVLSPEFTSTTPSLVPAAPEARSSWCNRAFSAVSEEGNLPTSSTGEEIKVDVPILATLPSMKSMTSNSMRHLGKDDLSNLSVDDYVDGSGEYCSSGSSHDVLSLTQMPPKSPFPSTSEPQSQPNP